MSKPESPFGWLNETIKSLAMAMDWTIESVENATDDMQPDRIILRYSGRSNVDDVGPELMKSAHNLIKQSSEDANIKLTSMSVEKLSKKKFNMTLHFVDERMNRKKPRRTKQHPQSKPQ